MFTALLVIALAQTKEPPVVGAWSLRTATLDGKEGKFDEMTAFLKHHGGVSKGWSTNSAQKARTGSSAR